MGGELVLSAVNERRLGDRAPRARARPPGASARAARALTAAGLVLRLLGRRAGPLGDRLPSVIFLAAALAYRLGWVAAGRTSALDHEAVATLARASRV